MLATHDFKRGSRLELDGDPWVIDDLSTQGPTARGSNTLVRVRLRNLRTGQVSDRTFKAGERVPQPDFEYRTAQYLYGEGESLHHFMDQETFEQFALPKDQLGDALDFLRPNDEVRTLNYNGACIGIELPHTLVMEVREVEPGARGDTATAVQKGATLETGLVIQVPLFIEAGEKVVVDTRERRYVRRG